MFTTANPLCHDVFGAHACRYAIVYHTTDFVTYLYFHQLGIMKELSMNTSRGIISYLLHMTESLHLVCRRRLYLKLKKQHSLRLWTSGGAIEYCSTALSWPSDKSFYAIIGIFDKSEASLKRLQKNP